MTPKSRGSMTMPDEKKSRNTLISTKEFLSLYRDYLKSDKTREDLIDHLKKHHPIGKDSKGDDKWDTQYSQFINRAILYIVKTKNIEILPALPERRQVSDKLKKVLDDLDL
jgi:hypothetical protein